MSFNPDPLKQATEFRFSKKSTVIDHLDPVFNNNIVDKASSQKHLGLIFDDKLNFKKYIDKKLYKATKSIGIFKKLYHFIRRSALLTENETFIRTHLEYGEIIYDQASNASCSNKIKSVQCNPALAITGAMQGTSRVKRYHELGLGKLSAIRWIRRQCFYYKLLSNRSPPYLNSIIPQPTSNIQTRYTSRNLLLKTRIVAFQIIFFQM